MQCFPSELIRMFKKLRNTTCPNCGGKNCDVRKSKEKKFKCRNCKTEF